MKIVIFGATGKVGRNLTDQAPEDGHQVTAFVRSSSTALEPHPNLHVRQGDLFNEGDVAQALRDQDAVMIALGAPLRNKDGVRARGTQSIIKAMKTGGPDRLICLSGHGTGDSYGDLPRLYRWLIMPLVLKHVYADHERQEEIVRASGLDWTLVRPTNYIKGPRSRAYKVNFGRKQQGMKFKISFADVADFMLSQLDDKSFNRAAASISG